MKKFKPIILISFALLVSSCLTAQVERIDSLSYEDNSTDFKKRDRLTFGLGNDIWLDAPSNVDIRNFNQSFFLSGMFDHRLGESPLTVGAGLGFQFNNLYSDGFLIENSVSKKTGFSEIPDSLNYSRNKISTSYIELPLEFRLRLGSEQQITIAAGFKVGYLISSHKKYKGDNYLTQSFSTQDQVKIKEYSIEDLTQLRYTVTGRIGFKSFSFFAHYNLSPLFQKGELVNNNNEPADMYLITAGISFSPF